MVRELLKYPDIEQIDMVEVNEGVVEACMKYLPFSASGLTDPKVTIYSDNSLRFIRHIENEYDVIIVDSAGLYGPERAFCRGNFTEAATRRSRTTA